MGQTRVHSQDVRGWALSWLLALPLSSALEPALGVSTARALPPTQRCSGGRGQGVRGPGRIPEATSLRRAGPW